VVFCKQWSGGGLCSLVVLKSKVWLIQNSSGDMLTDFTDSAKIAKATFDFWIFQRSCETPSTTCSW